MKDLFSRQAELYAKHRPTYPQELYDFVFKHVKHFELAWDCGTGNGQTAVILSKKFKQVLATDQSSEQLKYAEKHPNIIYSVSQAEKTNFASNSFDLVTVSQALHWFDFDLFYKELKRVLKPGGIFATWCYCLMNIKPDIDLIVDDLYSRILAPHWDVRRKFVNEKYQTIPFPFKKMDVPTFEIKREWTLADFISYLTTWSSVQDFIQVHGSNPVELIRPALDKAWGQPDQPRTITWPINLLLSDR